TARNSTSRINTRPASGTSSSTGGSRCALASSPPSVPAACSTVRRIDAGPRWFVIGLPLPPGSATMTRPVSLTLCAGLLCVLAHLPTSVVAQRGGMFLGSSEDPAIAYSTAPLSNAVSEVNAKLRDGRAQLSFDGRSGYLRSALTALD